MVALLLRSRRTGFRLRLLAYKIRFDQQGMHFYYYFRPPKRIPWNQVEGYSQAMMYIQKEAVPAVFIYLKNGKVVILRATDFQPFDQLTLFLQRMKLSNFGSI